MIPIVNKCAKLTHFLQRVYYMQTKITSETSFSGMEKRRLYTGAAM